MRILSIVFIGTLFVLSNYARAGNTPPDFDAAKWSQLVSQIILKGAPMETEEGSWRTLSRIAPADTTKSHQADYISTLGGLDSSGSYAAFILYDVSENWQINQDGNWDIDQWIYAIDVNGELMEVDHNDLVETRDGIVLGDKTRPTGKVSDPAVLQAWGQKLDAWYVQPSRPAMLGAAELPF